MTNLPSWLRACRLLLLLILLTGTSQAVAQQCSTELTAAEEAYTKGQFDKAIQQVETCLDKSGTSKEERQRAYRLLGLSYIGKDVLEEARASVQKLLEVAPNYQPDPVMDPPAFIELINTSKAEITQSPQPNIPRKSPYKSKPVKKSNSTKWLLIGGGIVLAGVVAVLAAMEAQKEKDNKEPSATKLNEVEPNNRPTQAQSIRGPYPVVVSGRSDINDEGEWDLTYEDDSVDDIEDWFIITTSETGLELILSGMTSDLDLHIVDIHNFETLGFSINSGSTTETINMPLLAAGRYYITVNIWDINPQGPTTTPYTLTINNGRSNSEFQALQKAIQAPGGAHLAKDFGLRPFVAAPIFSGRGLLAPDAEKIPSSASQGTWARRDEITKSGITIQDGDYEIPLQPGWNIISNLLDHPLDWGDVQTANRITQGLWEWDGHYRLADTFEPAHLGQAYYFFNSSNLPSLSVSSDHQQTRSAHKTSHDFMTLSVYREGLEASTIAVGEAEDAALGMDRYDQVAPPGYFEAAGLRIVRPDKGETGLMAREVRPAREKIHRFDLLLNAPPQAFVSLRAEGLEAFPGKEVYLIDPEKDITYDLRKQPAISFIARQAQTSFYLLVGDRIWVESEIQALHPNEVFQNYPNPFNQATTLSYIVPSSETALPVRLAVYTITGQLVRVLVDDRQPGGSHKITWDGTDMAGIPVATGTYFSRLHVGTKQYVRTLLLLK